MVFSVFSSSLLSGEKAMPKLESNKQFGKRLREIRKMKGLTLEDLSDKSDLHWKFIGQVERGDSDIKLNNIAKIATGLEMEIDELLFFCFPQDKLQKDAREVLAIMMPILKSNKRSKWKKLKIFIKEIL